ncbi:MAG: 2-amino-4-hydroxy-6-hydroxymethyldihydropteridine diphosphokinase [Chitinivibrionales bacterium]|nr:2-amino-4-hydroxy-6-hydroxymethyldihydropteridine diphosphokinase [Chitinivibrionales bacterium]MBD3395634.1 2-amino-4-hydroxy-6-hydroxymethyldihydropteridine diphosphokinase [Chitinivibrionales bacterium]
MPYVALSLGTNLNDRFVLMASMEEQVCRILNDPIECSLLMETEPVGMPDGTPWFLNRIVTGHSEPSAEELLARCFEIEKQLGRTRTGEVASRTADIDLLLYGDAIIANTNLTVPHARILSRRYCLEGLSQVAPSVMHPIAGKSFRELWLGMPNETRAQQVRFLPAPAGGFKGE